MELGALICTPARPRCASCPVQDFCAATEPEFLPIKKPRRKTVELLEQCVWDCTGGKLLLELQTGSRWRGMWKLPPITDVPAGSPLLRLIYPFTHHRVTLEVFASTAPGTVREQHRRVR
jgi:A/G-specific adenine glycosylase